MKNKYSRVKTKKRFKKRYESEAINPFSDFKSRYAHLTALSYLDSQQFAYYESLFPKRAREFYSRAGADKYNHDALDLDVDKHVDEEHKRIDEQYVSHLAVIEDLFIGVEVEKTAVQAKATQVEKVLAALKAEYDELRARFDSYNKKEG